MQAKTFLGKYRVRSGEREYLQSYLLVANTQSGAFDLLDEACRNHEGDGEPEDDGDEYLFDAGCIAVRPMSVTEVGLSTFLELRGIFPCMKEENVEFPTPELYEASLSEQAQHLTNALNRKEKVVSHSHVLNAIAATFGHKNWQILKAKLEASVPQPSQRPLKDVHLSKAME